MKRTVVYTAIANNYDYLRPVPSRLKSALDFICFSGRHRSRRFVNGWRIVALDRNCDDPTRACRFVKIKAHQLLQDYDSSLWLDANISFSKDVIRHINEFRQGAGLVMGVRHPIRNCIYSEAQRCRSINKDKPATIDRQLALIERSGYPRNNGLTETNILFRRHLDPIVISMMDEWWDWVRNLSCRDQLSFDFLLWKHGIKIEYLDCNSHGTCKEFRRGLHRVGPLFKRVFAFIEAYQMVLPGVPGLVNKIYQLNKLKERSGE